ncbi:MAG: beta galactosidase jelly roll domain-containing protein [Deltaproteobacteria bacterium]|nr:beta galactosidase jelly roll domain-containing protein [Deltaproteobacteria bacterium]
MQALRRMASSRAHPARFEHVAKMPDRRWMSVRPSEQTKLLTHARVIAMVIVMVVGSSRTVSAAPTFNWRASSTTSNCEGPNDGYAWHQPAFDDSSWTAIGLPDKGHIPNRQNRFYRGRFSIIKSANASISFDSDDGIWVWVNGAFKGHWGGNCNQGGCVGSSATGCSGPRVYLDISNDLVPGQNVVAAQVENGPSGSSYLSLYFTSFTDTSAPLDLIRPLRDGFCKPTCNFAWVPSADPLVAKYVLPAV